MDWIFDNLQIVIAIAGAIAYWLNARNKDKAGEPADYDGDGEPDNTPGGGRAMHDHEQSLEQEENNRRAQELIRRLREQRERGEATSSPAPASAPASDGRTIPPFQQPPPMPARDLRREQAEARRAAAEREQAEVLERQRGLAEQLAVLKARKAAAQREAASQWGGENIPAAAVAVTGVRHAGGDIGLLAELRDARSLKKAILLREVLGAPAGLR